MQLQLLVAPIFFRTLAKCSSLHAYPISFWRKWWNLLLPQTEVCSKKSFLMTGTCRLASMYWAKTLVMFHIALYYYYIITILLGFLLHLYLWHVGLGCSLQRVQPSIDHFIQMQDHFIYLHKDFSRPSPPRKTVPDFLIYPLCQEHFKWIFSGLLLMLLHCDKNWT